MEDWATGIFCGVTITEGVLAPVLTRIAFGFGAALMIISGLFRGIGVTKSFKAKAPSLINDPSLPIADTAVRVYALPCWSSVSRVTTTVVSSPLEPVRDVILSVLLSPCFIILSFKVSISTGEENLRVRCCVSITSNFQRLSAGAIEVLPEAEIIHELVTSRARTEDAKRETKRTITAPKKVYFIFGKWEKIDKIHTDNKKSLWKGNHWCTNMALQW